MNGFDPVTALGWAGMVLLLVAYGAQKRLPRVSYALMNITGAAMVGLVCFAQRAWPAFALECAWAAIALWQLLGATKPAPDAAP